MDETQSLSSQLLGELDYECPICHARSDGMMLVTCRTEVIPRPSLEELWPGGPLVAVPTLIQEWMPVAHYFSTDVCQHEFITELWDITVVSPPGERGLLSITWKRSNLGVPPEQ